MSKFAEADQPVFDYFSQIEEDLTETKQMLEEVVTLVYSYLSLPQHTDPPPHAFTKMFRLVHSHTTCHFFKQRDRNQAAIRASVHNHPAWCSHYRSVATSYKSCNSRGVKFDECTECFH